jgi:hypothetical protein
MSVHLSDGDTRDESDDTEDVRLQTRKEQVEDVVAVVALLEQMLRVINAAIIQLEAVAASSHTPGV